MRIVLKTQPFGQMRPRFSSRGKFHKAYKDPKQKERESVLIDCLSEFIPEKPIEGGIQLEIMAYMPRPMAHYRGKPKKVNLRPSAPIWHTKKPDADNLLKMIKDVMTGRFFKDDAQVCDESIKKLYSEFPRWEIELTQVIDFKG